MKEEKFITVKEEKTELAKYVWWLAAGWTIVWGIAAVIDLDGLLEDKMEQGALLLFGGGGLLIILIFGAVIWLQGRVAQRERRMIMENGRVVTGIVTGVEHGMRGNSKFVNSYVNVTYQNVDGEEKTWRSPAYSVEPYDYVGLQKECKMYTWGEKCCLAEVPKRKQPELDELMGDYAFLIPKEEPGTKEKHCVFKKGKKESRLK